MSTLFASFTLFAQTDSISPAPEQPEEIVAEPFDSLQDKVEGVEEIEAEGKTFDPYEHQPMMTETLEEVENDTILQVFQKGYKLKGKVIRPSMVKINKK